MNGEFQELYHKLDKKIDIFQAKDETRWNNHDERAAELKKEVQFLRKDIMNLKSILQCDAYAEKIKNMEGTIKVHWGLFVILISGFIGGFFWLMRTKL